MGGSLSSSPIIRRINVDRVEHIVTLTADGFKESFKVGSYYDYKPVSQPVKTACLLWVQQGMKRSKRGLCLWRKAKLRDDIANMKPAEMMEMMRVKYKGLISSLRVPPPPPQ